MLEVVLISVEEVRPVTTRFVPVALVKVKAARVAAPEMLREAPARYPEAVRLVLDAEERLDCPVTTRVPSVLEGVRISVEETTPAMVSPPVPVAFVKVIA